MRRRFVRQDREQQKSREIRSEAFSIDRRGGLRLTNRRRRSRGTCPPFAMSVSRNTPESSRRAAPLLIFHTVYGPLSGSARSVSSSSLGSFFSPFFASSRYSLFSLPYVSSTWTRHLRVSIMGFALRRRARHEPNFQLLAGPDRTRGSNWLLISHTFYESLSACYLCSAVICLFTLVSMPPALSSDTLCYSRSAFVLAPRVLWTPSVTADFYNRQWKRSRAISSAAFANVSLSDSVVFLSPRHSSLRIDYCSKIREITAHIKRSFSYC